MAEVGYHRKPDQGKALEMFRGFGSGVRPGHSKRVLASPKPEALNQKRRNRTS